MPEPLRRLRTVHVEMGRKWVGGAVQVLHLAEGLRARGHEACVVCVAGSQVEQRIRDNGVRTRRLRAAPDADPRLLLSLFLAMRAEQPDLVHLHSRRGADSWGLLAARAAGVRAVIVSRRVASPPPSGVIGRLKYGRLCDRVIAISSGIEGVLRTAGVPAEKIVCVRSGVDAAAFRREPCRSWLGDRLGLPDAGARVAVVGHLVRQKGHQVLLEAAPQILKRHPETRFLFFGEGPERQTLEREVVARGLYGHVVFAGFQARMDQALAGVDIVAHPAFLEGLGVAVLEALAAGKPVVASAAGGLPESVRHEETGLLVPPGDPHALAGALLRYLDDPPFAQRMGQQGAALVEREFTVEAMVEGNLRVYQSVLPSSPLSGVSA